MGALLFLVMLTQAVSPGLVAMQADPNVEIRTYIVTDGVTGGLRESMRAARIQTPDGRRAVTWSEWRYDWRWRHNEAGACDPASARTDHRIIVTIPALDPQARFSDGEVERWDVFIGDMIDYERERLALVVEGRDQTDAAMRAARDCVSMEAAARAVHAQTVRRLADFDEANTARRNRMVF